MGKSSGPSQMLRIILYTKPGCGLCEVVKTHLRDWQTKHPHALTEVDITSDPQLFAQYRYTIPVVQIGNIILQAPITAVALEAALANGRHPDN